MGIFNFFKRKPEARSVSLDQLLANFGVTEASLAGTPTVNELTSLSLTSVWCAMNVISRDIASLTPVLYRGEDSPQKAKDHPIYKLLRNPNPELTAPVFYETMQYFALHGNGCAEIERLNDGTPIALWPLPPNSIRFERNERGELLYIVGDKVLTSYDVIHIPGLSITGDGVGARLLSVARDSLLFGLNAQKFGNNVFEHSVRPSGFIEFPAPLNDSSRENYRKSLTALAAGVKNAGKVMLLEYGEKFNPLTMPTNEQTQLTQILAFVNLTVAQLFSLNVIKIGDMSRATWGNYTEVQRAHLSDCLVPWINKWEAELTKKLLRPDEQDDYYIEFDTSYITRANDDVRFANNLKACGKPWMTVNEIRVRENLPELTPEELAELEGKTSEPEPEPPVEPQNDPTGPIDPLTTETTPQEQNEPETI